MTLAGGQSILLGYRDKIGAWLLVRFLILVTPMMHKFWGYQRSHGRADANDQVHEEPLHAGRRSADPQFGAEPLTDMPKIAIVSGSTSTGWKNRAAAKWAPGRG